MPEKWGDREGRGKGYCSAEAASLDGEGRRERERGDEVMPFNSILREKGGGLCSVG